MNSMFTRFAHAVAWGAGRPLAFVLASALIIAWAISGPIFGYSETWQLVINTATTIITFLMVFVLQNTQNRDGTAIQAKLDELILVGKAENIFIEAEKLDEDDIKGLRKIIAEKAKLTTSRKMRKR